MEELVCTMLLLILFEQMEDAEEGFEQIKGTYERRSINASKEPEMSSDGCGVLTRGFTRSGA